MTLPLAQRVSQPRVLSSGKNDTPSGGGVPGRHRPFGRALLQIPPGTSPPIPKFPHSTIPISVCPHQNQQKSLYTDIPPHGCTTMVTGPPFPHPTRPPVLIQTVICPVQKIIQVWDQVPQCWKCWVWYGLLPLPCWSSHHTMTVGIQGIPPMFAPPTRTGSPHKAPWGGGTPGLPLSSPKGLHIYLPWVVDEDFIAMPIAV